MHKQRTEISRVGRRKSSTTVGSQDFMQNVSCVEHRCLSKITKGIKMKKINQQFTADQCSCGEELAKLGKLQKAYFKGISYRSNAD